VTGGEPLLHPQWAEIAGVLRSCGMRIGMATNGLLISRHAEALARCIDELYVSLDGATPESYQAIRGVAGLNLVERGIRQVAGKLPVVIRTTVQRGNFEEIPALLRLARSWGATHHSFLAVDAHSTASFGRRGDFDRSMNLRAGDLDRLARVLDETESEFDGEFARGYIVESKSEMRRLHGHFAAVVGLQDPPPVRCNAPQFSAVLETDGRIKPCFFLPASGRFDGSSLPKALNTAAGKDLRRQQRLGHRPECSRCVCPSFKSGLELRRGL